MSLPQVFSNQCVFCRDDLDLGRKQLAVCITKLPEACCMCDITAVCSLCPQMADQTVNSDDRQKRRPVSISNEKAARHHMMQVAAVDNLLALCGQHNPKSLERLSF